MLRWPNAAHARASGTGRFGSRPTSIIIILYDGNKVPGIDELNLADLIPLSQTCKLSSRRYAEHLLLPLRFTNDLLLLALRYADDLLLLAL